MVLEPLTPSDSLIVDSATCVLIAVIRELWEIMTSSSGGLSVHSSCCFFFLLINWIKDKQQREKWAVSKHFLQLWSQYPNGSWSSRPAELDLCCSLNTTLKKTLFILVTVAGFSFFHWHGATFNCAGYCEVQLTSSWTAGKCNDRHWHHILCKGMPRWNFTKQRPF